MSDCCQLDVTISFKSLIVDVTAEKMDEGSLMIARIIIDNKQG